jgi:uncharacterized membrane protein
MKQRIRTFFKHPFNWVLLALFLLNFFPILAPILMHLNLDFLAKPIYFFYSFTCHQFAHRSLHVYDHQCAWCSRDMAIWGSMLIVALLVKRFKLVRGMRWYWVLPFTIPIALDGGVQTIATMLSINSATGIPVYVSTNFMRMITGGLFGMGLGLWIMPNLYAGFSGVEEVISLSLLQMKKFALGSFGILVVAYLVFVQIWSVTSVNYKPANVLDLQVKTPVNKEFFLRREHGACPADAQSDPLAFSCFWGT